MPGCAPCGFLIGDAVLLEAGTAASELNLEAQQRIRHVLVSHVHLEHVQALAYLADNLFEPEGREPVELISLPAVIEDLQRHFFNDRIWPDFTLLPNPGQPVYRFRPLVEGEATRVGELEVRAFAVDHSVPSVGFLIRRGDTSFVYSGDTHHTEALWAAARQEPHLKAAFIEASFPDELDRLAEESGHLCPRQFATEFAKLGRPNLPVYAYHMKPRYRETLRTQLAALGLPGLTVLEDGMELKI